MQQQQTAAARLRSTLDNEIIKPFPASNSSKSFGDLENEDQGSMELSSVEIDALVVLKIIKHCGESLPSLVTGQLLGMDVADRLEVTHCFPFPTRVAASSNDYEDENALENATNAEDIDGAEYQMEMMKCLRLVNVDHNTVGWYQSTYLGSFVNQSMIETQYSYQENIPKSIILVYDPLKSNQGHLALRALRLSSAFMRTYKEKKFSLKMIDERQLSFENIFDTLSLTIRNAHLVDALLHEMPLLSQPSYSSLDLPQDPFVERHLQFMMDGIDVVTAEQSKLQLYERSITAQRQQQAIFLQRRRLENAARVSQGQEPLPELDDDQLRRLNPAFRPIPEPSRMESMLLHNQMNIYCSQLNAYSAASTTKLFLSNELRQA